jgi:hypothetical protein
MIANQPRTNGILPFKSTENLSSKNGYAVVIDPANAGQIIVQKFGSAPIFGVITQGNTVDGANSVAIAYGGVAGTVLVKLASEAKVGTLLSADGTGKFDATWGDFISAIALEAGSAGDLVEAVLVAPYNRPTSAF